jgi:hypothetical protein
MTFVDQPLRPKKLACWCIALQMLATAAMLNQHCCAQQGQTFIARLQEPLPTPPAPTPVDRTAPEGCPPAPVDTPLLALNVDIAPRNLNGEIVPGDQLPPDCAGYLFTDMRSANIDSSCACHMGLCDLLQLAAYCHNPLYFEERHLERYGVCSCCCQPLASALCFYGNALCLPAKMWRHCPCSCVPAHPCD